MAVGPGTESESGTGGLILAEGSNEAVFRGVRFWFHNRLIVF